MTKTPIEWKVINIGDVVSFNRKKPLQQKFSNLPVSFIPMAAVYEKINKIELNQEISHLEGQKRNLTYFENGDVIFAKITPCMENGKIALASELINGAAYGSTEFHVLSSSAEINALYLFYFLVSDDFRANAAMNMTGAVGQRRVPKKYLQDQQVPLPPIDEQIKIVEILEDHLSRIDSALEDVKQAREKTDQFRRSLLHAAFTGQLTGDEESRISIVTDTPHNWNWKRLGDCLDKLQSGKLAERGWSPQCMSNPVDNDDSWGVLKTTSVQMGVYLPEHNKELPNFLSPKLGLEVKAGDFLMTTTGPRNRCGITCYVDETPSKLIFSGKILRFRVNEAIILAHWLKFVLASPEYQQILDKLKVGSSDSSVSIGNQQILDLEIPVPPIVEQQRIVEILEEHLSRINTTLETIDNAERTAAQLRRSLLQAAFTGQLTKEDVNV